MTDQETEAAESEGRRSLWQRLGTEFRERRQGYIIIAIFAVAGPFVTTLLFPEAPVVLGAIGGLVFGAYAALCAVPDKMY